eukprot:Opistho-2@23313
MDNFGTLQIESSYGYNGARAHSVGKDTVAHACGSNVKFVKLRNGDESILRGLGTGIGPIAANRPLKVFAYAERQLKPRIYVFRYPELIRLKCLQDGTELEYTDLAFSRDGTLLASLGDLPDYTLTVWDWARESVFASISLADTPCRHLSFNPANMKELCASGNGRMVFFRMERSNEQHSLAPVYGKVDGREDLLFETHTWAPQNKVLGGCASGEIVSFDAANGDGRVIVRPADGSAGLAPGCADCIVATKDYIIVAGKDGLVRFLEARDPSKLADTVEFVGPVTCISATDDFGHLLVGSSSGRLAIVQSQGVHGTRTPKTIADCHRGAVASLAVASNGSWAASCGSFGDVRVWGLTSKGLQASVTPAARATCIASHPLAELLAVGGADGCLRVYAMADPTSPRLVHVSHLHEGPIRAVNIDERGRNIITGSNDGRVFLVDAQPPFAVRCYLAVREPVVAIASAALGEWSASVTRVVVATQNPTSIGYNVHGGQVISADIPEVITPQIARRDDPVNLLKIVDRAVSRVGMEIPLVATGIALVPPSVCEKQNNVYVLSKDRRMNVFRLPSVDEMMSMARGPVSSIATVSGHDKGGGFITIAPHHDWIASAAPDGCVAIRLPESPDRVCRTEAHDYRDGGACAVGLTPDHSRIVSAGVDGVVTVWRWQLSDKGHKAMDVVASAAKESAQMNSSMSSHIENALASRNTVTESADAPPKLELELALAEVHRAIDANFRDARTTVDEAVSSLQSRLQDLIAKNCQVPEIERLARDEFTLDADLVERMRTETEAAVARVRDDVGYENLSRMFLRDLLKEECWDSMESAGKSLRGFARQLEVSNYPMRMRSREEIQTIDYVKTMRKIEVAETEARRPIEAALLPAEDHGDSGLRNGSNNAIGYDHDDADGQDEGLGDDSTFEGDLKADFLYNPFSLYTAQRKRTQIILLRDVLHTVKGEFNREFEGVLRQKESEIGKIKERNDRIAHIMRELDTIEELLTPKMADVEQPERLLTVTEDEITVEKYISPEERARLAEQQRLEEERLRLERGDNAKERALDLMMGGRLDAADDDELLQELVRPEWMNRSEQEMTEDEIKALREFEKKENTMREEREKRRKALETELKKLQAATLEGCTAFDDRLQELFKKRIDIEKVVYRQELKIVRLEEALLLEEQIDERAVKLSLTLEEKKLAKAQSAAAVTMLRREVEACKDAHEAAAADDKSIERQFRREIADPNESQADTLLRLFRRRQKDNAKANGLQQRQQASHDADQLDPFAYVDAAGADLQREADVSIDMPSGMDPQVYERLIEFRGKKIEAEAEMRRRAAALAEIAQFLQRREAEDEKLRVDIEDLLRELKALEDERVKITRNLEVLFLLKQGQVEVEQSTLFPDFSDSLLIHRSVVEELNAAIVALGQHKVEGLKDMKEFRKGIRLLEWENTRLQMVAEDLVTKTRNVQLLRVTKQLQQIIKDGTMEHHAAEVAKLEKQLDHTKQSHEHKMEERQKALRKIRRLISKKRDENSQLAVGVRDLESAVDERRALHQVQAERSSTRGPGKRLKDIAARRRLVDLAKTRGDEISVLREEVERLRMRTFPSFGRQPPSHIV